MQLLNYVLCISAEASRRLHRLPEGNPGHLWSCCCAEYATLSSYIVVKSNDVVVGRRTKLRFKLDPDWYQRQTPRLLIVYYNTWFYYAMPTLILETLVLRCRVLNIGRRWLSSLTLLSLSLTSSESLSLNYSENIQMTVPRFRGSDERGRVVKLENDQRNMCRCPTIGSSDDKLFFLNQF